MNGSERRTLREAVLIPGAAALMPWSAGFRMLRRHARNGSLLKAEVDAAYEGARTAFPIDDGEDWKRRQRLVRLVDHCDLYLMRTRSDRWFDSNVDVEGAWPSKGPFIAMTFHWGAGLWALAHLKRHGYRPNLLAARIEASEFQGNAVAYRYARARNATAVFATGEPIIYTKGAAPKVRDALAKGQVVVALYDLPGDVRNSITTRVCGRPMRLPRGLARLAAGASRLAAGATVVPFSMGISEQTGRRRLRIEPAFQPADAQEFADRLGESLTRLLAEDDAAWHFAAFAPQFFTAPA